MTPFGRKPVGFAVRPINKFDYVKYIFSKNILRSLKLPWIREIWN
jgi:hypothetical protein